MIELGNGFCARIVTLFLALLLFSDAAHGAVDRSKVLRVSDRKVISFPRMIRELQKFRVVIVGETHNSHFDHQLELEIITRLQSRGVSLAIAMEMFSADRQEALDRWVFGGIDINEFVHLYYAEWRMPWPNYRDIFMYARREKIPMVGLNVSRDLPDKVSRLGFDALSPKDRAKLPTGISCDINSDYQEFITKAYQAHGKAEKSFHYFCEAQMLWNKVMAWHLATYLQRFPLQSVVVITGTGHAMQQAMPAALTDYLTVPVTIVMAESPLLQRRYVSRQETDYLVLR